MICHHMAFAHFLQLNHMDMVSHTDLVSMDTVPQWVLDMAPLLDNHLAQIKDLGLIHLAMVTNHIHHHREEQIILMDQQGHPVQTLPTMVSIKRLA